MKSTVFLVLAAALAACQSAPLVAPQTARQESGSPQASPVDQGRSFVYAPVFITGSGTISGQTTAKQSADGDLRSAESLRTGAMASTQSSSPSQDNSGVAEAVGKAAEAFLATVAPTSEAGKLAAAAVAAAKGGKADEAKTLLDKAKAAPTTPAPQ